MSLSLSDKQSIVEDLSLRVKASLSIAIAHYRDLTVSDLTSLRKMGREREVHVQIVRNTLAKRACTDTEFACMQPVLVGPTILLLAKDSPGAAARLMKDFAKDHEQLIPQGVVLGGELLGPESVEMVASLPTYDEAISMLMSVMQAPIAKMVRTIAEPTAKMVRTVAAIRDSKQAA